MGIDVESYLGKYCTHQNTKVKIIAVKRNTQELLIYSPSLLGHYGFFDKDSSIIKCENCPDYIARTDHCWWVLPLMITEFMQEKAEI